MADSHTRKYIFEISDKYYSGSNEDYFQTPYPNDSEMLDAKSRGFCKFRF